MAELTSGVRSILSIPWVYWAFQRLLGADRSKRRLVAENLRPVTGMRILDVACGPGNLLDFLPAEVEYVGFDHEPAYIDQARGHYGDRATFYCDSVAGMAKRDAELGTFDLVTAIGVLHHLNDTEARELFSLAERVLSPSGRVVTIDPCYTPKQSAMARFLISRDRGREVRSPDEYRTLPDPGVYRVESLIEHGRLRLPFTHHIMECVCVREEPEFSG